MPMPDPAKERYWRAVIADSDENGLSRAEYCRQHGINNIQLRNWIARLKRRDALSAREALVKRRETARVGQKTTGKKRPTPKVNRTAHQARATKDVEQPAAFAEVRLIERREEPRATKPDNGSSMEIVFSSGTKALLTAGCPLDLLASVVKILEGR
jgi:transposase-like protein